MPTETEEKQRIFETTNRYRTLADWIMYDAKFDCDDEAYERTEKRLKIILDNHEKESMLGIVVWWAHSAYVELMRAHHLGKTGVKAELNPMNVDEILSEADEDSASNRRAFVTAQQFISTLTHANPILAEAIFNTVFDAGLDELILFMKNVLSMSVRVRGTADRIIAMRT